MGQNVIWNGDRFLFTLAFCRAFGLDRQKISRRGRKGHWLKVNLERRQVSIYLVFGTDPDRNRVGIGKPPAVKQFPSIESHLGIRASYATRRKRRYEANKCG
jgi:hypothetical protein